jgi:hypothetical protein
MAKMPEVPESRLPLFSFIGVVVTGLFALASTLLTLNVQSIVQHSSHAEAFVKALSDKPGLTKFMRTYDRTDEQEADETLTAINDFAQTPDDKMAMLSIGARMLNSASCPSAGEATARFLALAVEQLKLSNTSDSQKVLAFARSQPFLDLASSDIPLVIADSDAPPPSCVPESARKSARVLPIASPKPINPLRTPDLADYGNHTAVWGEETAWTDAKNELFRELRADDYRGWIHVATWELEDTCIDALGTVRVGARCTPIRIHYTSTPFHFGADNNDLNTPFWLGRARFLRDAPPHIYVHKNDTHMKIRGTLGHVVGIVDYGECVQPLSRPQNYIVEIPNGRKFDHAWIEVGPAAPDACATQ